MIDRSAPRAFGRRFAVRLGSLSDPTSHAFALLVTLTWAAIAAASVVRLAQTMPIDP